MLYCQASFARGTGFGNRLFPWARCRIFSQTNNIPMIFPQWTSPRIGPLIRGGIDLKSYPTQILLLNLFQKRADEIGGLRRLLLSYRAGRIPEPDQLDAVPGEAATSDNRDSIVLFKGDKDQFADLQGREQYIHGEIRAMTRKRWLRIVDQAGEVPIGINVRRGKDFRDAKSEGDYFTKGAIRTPLAWYIESLRAVREIAGFPTRAVVVSDGTEEDLKELLSEENVTFLRPGCAISDLLVLAKSRVFIAAGGSSFSAWASFLGQMPTLAHPGQSLTWFKLASNETQYVGEFRPHAPAPIIVQQVKRIFQSDQ